MPIDSPNGEMHQQKLVAIEPIRGSIKYVARSHYHPVLSGDHIHSRVFCGTVSRKVIYRANVQSARTKMDHDKRVDLLGGVGGCHPHH